MNGAECFSVVGVHCVVPRDGVLIVAIITIFVVLFLNAYQSKTDAKAMGTVPASAAYFRKCLICGVIGALPIILH